MDFETGKFKGKSIRDMLMEDINYCIHFTKILPSADETKELMCLFEECGIDDNSYYMVWGKHAKRYISWIKANDPSYIKWLRNNEFVKKNCFTLMRFLS